MIISSIPAPVHYTSFVYHLYTALDQSIVSESIICLQVMYCGHRTLSLNNKHTTGAKSTTAGCIVEDSDTKREKLIVIHVNLTVIITIP